MRIGFVLKSLDEEYQASIYYGVKQETDKLGIDLVCIQGGPFDEDRNPFLHFFSSCSLLPLDGILLLSSVIVDNSNLSGLPEMLSGSGDLPVVSIGGELPGFHSILVETEESLKELVGHLIHGHGYRRFLYIGGPVVNRDNMVRENTIRAGIAAADADGVRCSLTVRNGDLFSEKTGTTMIRDYIHDHPKRDIDTVIAGSDDIALGILKYLKSRDSEEWRTCPVTGFDDIPQARFSAPPLTTVRQPLKELGSKAAVTLYSLLSENKVPLRQYVSSGLLVRNSCGCDTVPETVMAVETRRDIDMNQLIRDTSGLGQALMIAADYREIIPPLSEFLAAVNSHEFSFLLFPEPVSVFPDRALLLYSQNSFSEEDFTNNPREVVLSAFFAEISGKQNRKHAVRFLFHLRSGDEHLGLVFYSVEDYAHPFMSNCVFFLSNTLKRIQIFKKEKERAEELERLVAERTAELEKEAKRRVAVEAEVLKISELERMRFSMDLHDDICQRLAGMAMISRNFRDTDPSLQLLSEVAAETLRKTRQYAHDSFPMDIDAVGMNEALCKLCDSLDGRNNCSCVFSSAVEFPERFSQQQKINIYRIVQEALNNAVTHSGADLVRVTVTDNNGSLVVQVRDNGRGRSEICGRKTIITKERRPRGLGLRSMEYRAHQLNAEYF